MVMTKQLEEKRERRQRRQKNEIMYLVVAEELEFEQRVLAEVKKDIIKLLPLAPVSDLLPQQSCQLTLTGVFYPQEEIAKG